MIETSLRIYDELVICYFLTVLKIYFDDVILVYDKFFPYFVSNIMYFVRSSMYVRQLRTTWFVESRFYP